jgi:hypothetical protein
MKGRRA